jgi:hypothetical protein
MDKIGAYLAGADASIDERARAARLALRNGHDNFHQFVSSRIEPTEVVCTVLSIDRAEEHLGCQAYRELPGPLTLLAFCSANCFVGDGVSLKQITAQRGAVTVSEDWPFGLDTAEHMTRPAAAWMDPSLGRRAAS